MKSKRQIVGFLLGVIAIGIILWKIVDRPENPCATALGATQFPITSTKVLSKTSFQQKTLTEITPDNANRLTRLWNFKTDNSIITDIAISPIGNVLAIANDQIITIVDVSTVAQIATLQDHQEQILRLVFSPDGTKLASASRDKSAHIWNTSTWTEIGSLTDFSGTVYDLSFSPDGEQLVTVGDANDGVKVWNTNTYTLIRESTQRSIVVDNLSFNPNGSCIVVSEMPFGNTGGRQLHLINLVNFADQALPRNHSGDILRVIFSPSGKWIASAGADETVRIWDVQSNKELEVLQHTSDVNDIVFNSAENLLISASGDLGGNGDNSIQIWGLDHQLRLSITHAHQDLVSAIALSPDGKLLVSAGYDGMVHFWGVDN